MANKLIILISSRDKLSRITLAKQIFADYLNSKINQNRFVIQKEGKEYILIDTFSSNRNQKYIAIDYPNTTVQNLFDSYSIKVYDFAEPIKRICIEVLGLDISQCYGSEDDKNSHTHISWEDFYQEIREHHSKPRRGSIGHKLASGFMSGSEVFDVLSNDILRRVDHSSLSRALFSQIAKDGYEVAIVLDASYPTDITMGCEGGAKAIRLLKDPNKDIPDPLQDFPLGEFTIVVDNEKLDPLETYKKLQPTINSWIRNI